MGSAKHHKMVTKDDVRRLKSFRRWRCQGNEEVRLSSDSARNKSFVAIAGIV